MMRPSEYIEAGREITGAAQLIGALDSGKAEIIRIGKPMVCRSCDYNSICDDPGDTLFVDQFFTRGTPKRLKSDTFEPTAPVAVPF
jgi:hypothetical protein